MRGKSIDVAGQKFLVRGVTYGGFRGPDGGPGFPARVLVEHDFAAMAAAGVNTVRTYTVPPLWLLDLAHACGLRVMVGLAWEQHVAFLRSRGSAARVVEAVAEAVRGCRAHPAVLCYAVGNEIPSSIVRWYGPARIERFLHRLCRTVKQEDPAALVTYVNYPSTEYLRLPFVDLICFNVFLESEDALRAYLAYLQTEAGDRPLVLTELGLDSRRNGERGQARAVEQQLRAAFELGCAGACVFSWTDEWHRGGHDVLDWDFGLVDRSRLPKPALAAARRMFAEPLAPRRHLRASVVVCTYNGERWLRDCLEALERLDHPDHEVIVVDDGSTDRSAAIVRVFPRFRLISTPNGGLSRARNVGLAAATGEIVAYVDDDARPDPSWLTHLTGVLERGEHVAVGGPNIPPPDDGYVAQCVANAPGGPIHVLRSETEAEHVPGCNMAFLKFALEGIGGFDPAFRVAGDDVDVCWRLHEAEHTIGFSAGAVVYHRRRGSIGAYLRQQREYGKAEALLERKWPQHYNRAGHLTWSGRLYGDRRTGILGGRRGKVRYGTWGAGLFQSVYQPAQGLLTSLPLMPEWYLVLCALAALGALGAAWPPLLVALPLLALAAGATLFHAWAAARQARFAEPPPSRKAALGLRGLTLLLHLAQPPARLLGRLRYGLSPWRRRCLWQLGAPWPRTTSAWSQRWRSPGARLQVLEQRLREACPAARSGGDYDRWDLEVRGGALAVARVRLGIEEHGSGRQVLRFKSWPVPSRGALAAAAVFGALAAGATADGVPAAAAALAAAAAGLILACLRDCANASGVLRRAIVAETGESTDELLLDRADRPAAAVRAAVAMSTYRAAPAPTPATNGGRPGEDARWPARQPPNGRPGGEETRWPAPQPPRFARPRRTLDAPREAPR